MKALGLLIKPASGSCQMRCRYCFYENVSESRATANYGLMSLATLERLVDHAIRETTGQCTFSFQGGEPTLVGLDFYRELVRLQVHYRELYGRKGLEIRNTLQTNGLLLDDEWAAFLAENRFLVGLSLDGDKDIHDSNRIDAAGRGTYSRTLKAARLLERHGVDFNILCVVTSELARRARHVYRSLVRSGFRYLQFIPCIDDFGAEPGSSPHSLTAERYGDFLVALFDEWHQDFLAGRYTSIRHFDNWIHMLQGQPPETCSMSGRCVSYGVVEADGSVYPCDFYVLDAWRLGSVHTDSFESMLTGARAQAFVQASLPLAAKCASCPYLAICRGGCRRDREPLPALAGPGLPALAGPGLPADPGEGQPGSLNVYCAAYERFFAHALGRMQEIARRLG